MNFTIEHSKKVLARLAGHFQELQNFDVKSDLSGKSYFMAGDLEITEIKFVDAIVRLDLSLSTSDRADPDGEYVYYMMVKRDGDGWSKPFKYRPQEYRMEFAFDTQEEAVEYLRREVHRQREEMISEIQYAEEQLRLYDEQAKQWL